MFKHMYLIMQVFVTVITSLVLANQVLADAVPGTPLPTPVVGWSCTLPPDARLGDDITIDSETFAGFGSDPALNQLHFLPNGIDPARCRVRWAKGARGGSAVSLGMLTSGPEASAVLQCGDGAGTLTTANKLTLFVDFKINLPMAYGGGSPSRELDGYLINLAPNVLLMVSGRGETGRGKRVPCLVTTTTPPNSPQRSTSRYDAQLATELQMGQWYRLVVSWDGSATAGNNAPRTRLWLNGKECSVKGSGQPATSPRAVSLAGPLFIGGNRGWGNVLIDLGGFAIYNSVLTEAQVAQLNTNGLGTPPVTRTVTPHPAYEPIPAFNQPDGWQAAPAPFTLKDGATAMLAVSFSQLAANAGGSLYLKQPLPLDAGVTSVNFWACYPADGSECGIALTPLFADQRGKEIAGKRWEYLSSHIAPPNSRKAGFWGFCSADVPRKEGATQFLGFSIKTTYVPGGQMKATKTLYLKDLGLERIKYASVPLYYVVGNYRDNYLSGSGARGLTDQSGGATTPYLLLDNLVDSAKQGRPAQLNVRLFAYDTQDRLVYTTILNNLPAKDTPDFFTRIPIPLTTPGTYRIKGKSYNAVTGEYFTTDWVKLIVLKGAAKPLAAQPENGLLAINSAKPFGRLEKTDKQEITFQVGAIPATGPCELRYAVIPYQPWVPVRQAVQPVTLDQTIPVAKPGKLTVPYVPKRTVELVVAELWQGGKRIEREERLIGIRNELDKAPVFTNRAKIPSLDDLAGPGKNWMNIQLHENPGNDQLQNLAQNIDEAKKLTPNLGFRLDLNRLEPIPGVYDWDYLTPMFDLAAQKGCRIIPYMNLKWPVDWAPVEFQVDADGCAHRVGTMWGYMVGKYLYPNGEYGPQIIRQFCTQFARQYLNHPGLGGYYFENEHIGFSAANGPLNSYHAANRKRFETFLATRYGVVAKLNAAYGTRYAAFSDVPLPVTKDFPPQAMLADYTLFMSDTAETFVLRDEFNAVRQEDPQRPIIVYHISPESNDFLQKVVQGGGMMANGGIHSNFHVDFEYERYNAVSGLRYRMEPHDMWNYDPMPHGFDEMIFGMLAMGGRGLQNHIFLPGTQAFNYDKAMQPGQRTGLDKLVKAAPMLRELRDTEKQHDPIGIMELHSRTVLGKPFEWTIWSMHCALFAFKHYSPRVVFDNGRLDYLDGSKVIFVGGSVIDAAQLAYLTRYVQNGGKLVMPMTAGECRMETPDTGKTQALMEALGIDFFAPGTQLPDIKFMHDLYTVGKGQVLVMRSPLWLDQWEVVVPALMQWAGVTERLADSDDRYMQMHVLRHGDAWYLATTHRSSQQSGYAGPKSWAGNARFCQPLPAGQYRVTEMMANTEVGIFTPEQLAAGFAAGNYEDLEMKLFKITPVK
ncbi:MAG TPA: beta-galactosidase [Armatimonadota bacterium]